MTMRFLEIMEPVGEYVSANDYALDALHRLNRMGCDWAFVLDRDTVAGVLFARDLVGIPERSLRRGDVREYMRKELIQIGSDIDMQEADRLMRVSRQSFLAVVEGNQPIGIVTDASLSRHSMPAIA